MTKLGIAVLVIVAILVGGAGPALAWGRHHVFVHGFFGPRVFIGPGVFIGAPFWYPYPYPYYPPPVIVEPAPTPQVYVQPQPPAQPQYWYYCEDPRGYYPYVQQCPGGWLQVVPRTSPQ